MDHKERMDVIKKFMEEKCYPVLAGKGNDYAGGSPDANANFKESAILLGMSKYQIWSVYFMKHFFSLKTWLAKGHVESEPIESRLVDMINYLLILMTMQKEDEEKKA